MNKEKKIIELQILTAIFCISSIILLVVSAYLNNPIMDLISLVFIVGIIYVIIKRYKSMAKNLGAKKIKKEADKFNAVTQFHLDRVDKKIKR